MDREHKLRQLFREYRLLRKKSQAEVAEAIGLDRSAYVRVERGERRLSPAEYEIFCRVIGCNPIALLREAGYTAFLETEK